ncbi:YadA C-terminal domain-containing protein [Fusobacterium necrophorum subsp. funduliforme]
MKKVLLSVLLSLVSSICFASPSEINNLSEENIKELKDLLGFHEKLDISVYERDKYNYMTKEQIHREFGDVVTREDLRNVEVRAHDKINHDVSSVRNYLLTNYESKIHVDYKLDQKANKDLSNVSSEAVMKKVTKGNMTSNTLTIEGSNSVLRDVNIELKENSIGKKYLTEELAREIDEKANKKSIEDEVKRSKETDVKHNRAIVKNRESIANNSQRIEQIDKKISKIAALSQATANLDFGNVRVGNIAVGAAIGNYMNETGIAVGVAYRPNEDIFLSAKWTALAGESRYNSYGASASYQFNLK